MEFLSYQSIETIQLWVERLLDQPQLLHVEEPNDDGDAVNDVG